jgi:exodeoxyribonuclease VII small subunit
MSAAEPIQKSVPTSVTFLGWTVRSISSTFRFVPNVTRNAGQINTVKTDTLPFEEALEKLESIVEAMESAELPLESLLAKYEEGTRLARICQSKLAEAELKIQQLEKNAAGEMKLAPMPLPENGKMD